MPEQQPTGEEYKNWKAPKTGADDQQETQEAVEAGGEEMTPEAMIEQVPEDDRGTLRKMGERMFGKAAIDEVAGSIKAQTELARELGTGLKSPIKWENIDKKRALTYGGYALTGLVAAELGSPGEAGAEEGDANDAVFKQAMFDSMPLGADGERLTSSNMSESQRTAFMTTYQLREMYSQEGGTPADYEMQADDLWRVQQELAETEFSRGEQSRVAQVSEWGNKVMDQHELVKDLSEEAKPVLDNAMTAAEEIQDLSAQERLVLKGAVLEALAKNNDNPSRADEMIKAMLASTESVQEQEFYRPESERFELQRHYDLILSGAAEQAGEQPPSDETESTNTVEESDLEDNESSEEAQESNTEKSKDANPAQEISKVREEANWEENTAEEKIPEDWASRYKDGTWTSEDGKVTFVVGHGTSRDMQLSVNKALSDARGLLTNDSNQARIAAQSIDRSIESNKGRYESYQLMAIPTQSLE